MSKLMKTIFGSNRRNTLIAWMFVSPWAIGFLIFGMYPIVMSLYYSLCQYDVLRVPRFVGLQNYQALLFEDPYFWKSLWNTLYYVVFRTPLAIFGSLLLASLLNQQLKGMPIFRTIFFIPSIISGVVLSVIWLWM
ncbi:MAG: sugar ABC transporter permease, partial [FCB group bacterium]|nr:sugar ABC transporter permease [FCB group bacterium]